MLLRRSIPSTYLIKIDPPTNRYGSFSNRNGSDSRVSHVSWINETNKSLLMTAAGDGVVRVWGGVMEAGGSLDEDGQGKMQPPELVTGFQAIPVREGGRRR